MIIGRLLAFAISTIAFAIPLQATVLPDSSFTYNFTLYQGNTLDYGQTNTVTPVGANGFGDTTSSVLPRNGLVQYYAGVFDSKTGTYPIVSTSMSGAGGFTAAASYDYKYSFEVLADTSQLVNVNLDYYQGLASNGGFGYSGITISGPSGPLYYQTYFSRLALTTNTVYSVDLSAYVSSSGGSITLNQQFAIDPAITPYFGNAQNYTLIFSDGAQNDAIDMSAPTVPSTSAVPEPDTWIMMIAGFGAIGLVMRRRSIVLLQFFD